MEDFKFGGYKGFFSVYKRILEWTEKGSSDLLKKALTRQAKIKVGDGLYGTLALLRPTEAPVPPPSAVKIFSECKNSTYLTNQIKELFWDAEFVAVDIETRGTRAHDSRDIIVGIGVASERSIAYFDLMRNSERCNKVVLEWLKSPKLKLIAHNVYFDGAFLLRYTGEWLNWEACTYGLYKQLANEGFLGQKWGLKDAQVQLLGWPDRGDIKLDKWLVANRYISNSYRKNATTDELLAEYNVGKLKPKKGEMWRAPADILGYYCGLDCASTYQLFSEVLLPAVTDSVFEQEFLSYHDIFIKNVELLVRQQLSGISINRPDLEKYYGELVEEIKKSQQAFFSHPSIRPNITLYNKGIRQEILDKEPVKYKKMKKIGDEPKRLTKTGKVSKVWENWNKRKNSILDSVPEVSKS